MCKLIENDVVEESVIEQCHRNSELSTSSMESFELSSAELCAEPPPPAEFFTAVEAAKMEQGQNWDMRPHLFDNNSKQFILLDSGAQVSAYPPDPGDQIDQ